MNCIAVDLAYEEHGQGFPLVLIHGFPLDRSIWNPVIPLLKDHARVILPDLRGYGQTPPTDGVYYMRLMAEDILRLLDRLGIERAILAGHSMGGYVSLAFAHAYPNRLAGLALVTSQTMADNPEKRQSRYTMSRNVRRSGTAPLAKKLTPIYTDNPAVAEEVRGIIARSDSQTVIASLKGMAEREDAAEWADSIRVPVLVVAGGKDKLIPIEKARTFVQFFPRSWLVELEDCAHMAMMEDPAGVAGALVQLVQRAEGVHVSEK